MTPLKRLLLLVVALVAPTVASLAERSASERKPPEARDLIGAWSGYEDGCVYFYRLVLQKGGRGKCNAVFTDETVDSYIVDEWRMEAGRLVLRLSPVNASVEGIKITVRFVDNLKIVMLVAGTDREWKREATLYNEKEFFKRLRKGGAPKEAKATEAKAATH